MKNRLYGQYAELGRITHCFPGSFSLQDLWVDLQSRQDDWQISKQLSLEEIWQAKLRYLATDCSLYEIHIIILGKSWKVELF